MLVRSASGTVTDMADDVPRTAPVTVLVDARNVLRSRWPNIAEDDVVARCRAWAARSGRRAVVVFDGTAPRGIVGEEQIDPHCVVVGTGRESADEWLERAAARQRAAGTPYWLVTSDRALRAAAGAGAERVVGGGSFARELTALEPGV